MPHQSITDLRNAIEAAPEMTTEHREQMLALVNTLGKEVAQLDAEDDGEHVEKLRGAIVVASDVIRNRAAEKESDDGHDLSNRLTELEEKAEMVAVEHPVIANILNAISRLT